MRKSDLNKLKDNINVMRKEKKIKVSELCDRIGRDRFYLSQMTSPSIKTIIEISQVLECEPSELLKGL